MDQSGGKRTFTRQEVSLHNTRDSCYTIVHGKVYDITHYMEEHPGGVDLMFRHAGRDCTADFEAIFHSQKARQMLEQFYVGDLADEGLTASSSNHINRFARQNRLTPSYLNPAMSGSSGSAAGGYGPYGLFARPTTTATMQQQQQQRRFARPMRPVLGVNTTLASNNAPPQISVDTAVTAAPQVDSDDRSFARPAGRVLTKQIMTKRLWQKFKLHSVVPVNHDTKIFKFRLPSKNMKLTIEPGEHIHVNIPPSHKGNGDDGDSIQESIVRKYTPTRTDEAGFFELLVKRYEGGPASTYIHNMQVGEELAMRGFFGLFTYDDAFRKRYSRVGMICCGTGIAPMIQILKHALLGGSRGDSTQFHLLFANRTEKDILLKGELDAMYQMHSDRFQVHYLLSRPNDPDYPLRGHINRELFAAHISFEYDPNTFILVCGTTGFSNLAVDISKQSGYNSEHIHVF